MTKTWCDLVILRAASDATMFAEGNFFELVEFDTVRNVERDSTKQ